MSSPKVLRASSEDPWPRNNYPRSHPHRSAVGAPARCRPAATLQAGTATRKLRDAPTQPNLSPDSRRSDRRPDRRSKQGIRAPKSEESSFAIASHSGLRRPVQEVVTPDEIAVLLERHAIIIDDLIEVVTLREISSRADFPSREPVCVLSAV